MDNNHCLVTKDVLSGFCKFSSLKINFNKSMIFAYPNIFSQYARVLSQNHGIHLTTDLGKYLGVPLIHNMKRKEYFKDLTDKVTTKLLGWKAKFQYFMGIATLIQSVTIAISNYTI